MAMSLNKHATMVALDERTYFETELMMHNCSNEPDTFLPPSHRLRLGQNLLMNRVAKTFDSAILPRLFNATILERKLTEKNLSKPSSPVEIARSTYPCSMYNVEQKLRE